MLTQATACFDCGMLGHQSSLCPSLPFSSNAPSRPQPLFSSCPQLLDRRGRKIELIHNRPICNNFNEGICSFSPCNFLHICSFCRDAHPKFICPPRSSLPRTRQGLKNLFPVISRLLLMFQNWPSSYNPTQIALSLISSSLASLKVFS
ncbi:hypothetical protein ILYODFUR_031484 [Ilyodon furcidens]|uniref:Cleavage and polyadenylation specificity factor subunit 4 n=1 Tax=Ilyodon furcidens TaxID=33524 RepID=A0ABV0TZB4_9TELE